MYGSIEICFTIWLLAAEANCRYIFHTAGHSHNYNDSGTHVEPNFYSYPSICPQDAKWACRPFEPIRIRWFITNLQRLSSDGRHVINTIMNETVLMFTRMLLVRRSTIPVGVPHDASCGHAGRMLHTHVRRNKCDTADRNGVSDADYVVYIGEAGEGDCKGGTLALAGECGEKSFDKRPTAGHISLCANEIKTANWNRHSLARTLQHELFHALGLGGHGLSTVWYSLNGRQMEGRLRISRTWKINSNLTIDHVNAYVVTPKVKSFVRAHFNCDTLEGAELENEGGGGTAGVHWEVRIYGPEVMTGYISRRSYISNLTLSFLEDTTWYKANYATAEVLTFGKGYGCTFAQGSCREFLDERRGIGAAKPFCTWEDYVEKKRRNAVPRECSADLTYYSKCDWKEVKNADELDNSKQYFLDKWTMVNDVNVTGANVYGAHESRDGCPQWTEYYYADVRSDKIGDSICQNEFSQPPAKGNFGAELFGEDSICFEQDGKFEIYECWPFGVTAYDAERDQGAGCYNYTCHRGRLMIQANYSREDPDPGSYMRQFKTCWGKGSVVQIRRHQNSGQNWQPRYHKGLIICPDCRRICEDNPKYPNFKCANDIHLNSTDYSDVPCPQEQSGTYHKLLGCCHFLLLVVALEMLQ